MHFCFFAQFVEFSLNIANICAAAARGCVQLCGLGVWASGDYLTRYLNGARMQLFWTLDSSPAQVQISAEFTWEYRHQWAAVGQNWSTDIFNGNKKLAAMCHGRFCFQAPLIAQDRKNGQKWRKQTNGKIFNELQGSRIAPVVTVGWWWPD